jgi:hypothetical protein
LRFSTSMAPSRWNSLITFETASRVEATMFAKVLVRQAHLRAACRPHWPLPKRSPEAQQQRRQARRDLAVQEALYDLIGLPEPLGERREQLQGELGITLRGLRRAYPCGRRPPARRLRPRRSRPAPASDEAELAEDGALLQQGRWWPPCSSRRSCTGGTVPSKEK